MHEKNAAFIENTYRVTDNIFNFAILLMIDIFYSA